MLDPFLLLDEIRSDRQEDWIRGFPTHPHRGFETVSYLIDGRFEHADSVGNHGVIGPGDCQWMTAGRGIVHSEMPRQDAGNTLWGLQLWINLPARHKMTEPRYQDIGASSIPRAAIGDCQARIVTGAIGRVRGPVDGIAAQPLFLDISVPAGASLKHPITSGHAAFAYMLEGSASFGAQARQLSARQTGVFGDGAEMSCTSESGARFLLFAAAPIREPVARRGPFVMNTEAELREAFADYRSGRLTGG